MTGVIKKMVFEGLEIGYFYHESTIWFVGNDVCAVLGYSSSGYRNVLARLGDSFKNRLSVFADVLKNLSHNDRLMTCVNRAGFIELAKKCKLKSDVAATITANGSIEILLDKAIADVMVERDSIADEAIDVRTDNPFGELIAFGDKRVRMAGTCEKPWFCGNDVAEILGYNDAKRAIHQRVKSQNKRLLSQIHA